MPEAFCTLRVVTFDAPLSDANRQAIHALYTSYRAAFQDASMTPFMPFCTSSLAARTRTEAGRPPRWAARSSSASGRRSTASMIAIASSRSSPAKRC